MNPCGHSGCPLFQCYVRMWQNVLDGWLTSFVVRGYEDQIYADCIRQIIDLAGMHYRPD